MKERVEPTIQELKGFWDGPKVGFDEELYNEYLRQKKAYRKKKAKAINEINKLELMSWKNDRAEKEMREGTEDIRLAALERAKNKEPKFAELPGKFKITFSATEKVEEGEVAKMLEEIEAFSKKCDNEHPNVSILIEPLDE